MNPCGYLPSREFSLMMAGLPGTPEPSWWVLYGPAVIAVLLVFGLVIAYDAWAQLTGHLTLSNMIRRGPGWLKALVGGGLAWLWVHLMVQGRRAVKTVALAGLTASLIVVATVGYGCMVIGFALARAADGCRE